MTTILPTSLSPADAAAHAAASHVVSWSTRETYLRNVGANGLIPTCGGLPIGQRINHWAYIDVTVEYVSPVSPDGVAYLVLASLDGQGKALAVVDGHERPDADGWMYRDYVTLYGRAVSLFGQPALDMRRSTFEAVA